MDKMAQIFETLFNVFSALAGLSLVVVVHEFGHFIVAKWTGMAVETFSIGFGKPLWKKEYKGTVFQFCPILLGGYVKPKGEFEEKEGKTPEERDPDEFLAKPWYARAAVLIAGPIMNFIFPLIMLFLIYSIVGKQEGPPQISEVIQGRPAAQAGVLPGDYILAVDGIQTPSFTLLSELVDRQARSHQGKPLSVTLLRDGKVLKKEVAAQLNADYGVKVNPGVVGYSSIVKYASVGTPAEKVGFQPGDRILSVGGQALEKGYEFNKLFARAKEDPVLIKVERKGAELMLAAPKKSPLPEDLYDAETMGLIGLVFDLEQGDGPDAAKAQYKPLSFRSAAVHSFYDNLEQGMNMVYGIYLIASGQLGLKENLGGPVMIMRMATQKAESGFIDWIKFMCMISLILGIMNLLPIPMLDGGTFMFCVLEGLRGKPLPQKLQLGFQNVGAFLLIGLMIFITFNDIVRWVGSYFGGE